MPSAWCCRSRRRKASFLERLIDHGEIVPALLTNDPALGERIAARPMLAWKALNVRRHAGKRAFPGETIRECPPGAATSPASPPAGRPPCTSPATTTGSRGLPRSGRFEANAAGLQDLAGNASEWTHDVYDPKPPEADRAETDSMDTRPARWHVVKGPRWRSGTLSELRAAWRAGRDGSRDDLGFRIARYVAGGS